MDSENFSPAKQNSEPGPVWSQTATLITQTQLCK